ncbi:hypothetical protein AMS68_004708 [Peltaster fructicola]|uniref:Hemerythrin-like domain-containing protein n=1 Tax=Peltaster fructicola TaxID=286661 RepID=A0A6H0XX03_9PEZI|nr:hypothetical protein AMS68_004708 [Peltaster fructicola]
MPDIQGTTNEAAPTQAKKMTPAERRQYDHMAEHMDMFHNHFRQNWNEMYAACSANKRPGGISIRAFLNQAEEFCRMLTMHHTIEERHIFPVLAKKMPAFREELELLTHHKRIHEGIDKMEAYIAQCRSGETEFRMAELKNIMDSFGAVLWEHLDAEVAQLRAENMVKYWTLEEMRRMPM